jgi:hypothetical protein
MGSTLTSTQPKDTYKSLLKTSDTTELSATAKYVSDGNGNDSPLALSTANVGIGTDAPTVPLDVVGATASEQFRVGNTTGGTDFGITVIENDAVVFNSAEGATARDLVIQLGGTERARFTINGLTFNGDTAANNALSDYEQGTFTPTTEGDATGAFSGVLGEYTKIGNVVHFRIAATISTNFTSFDIGGLPFTIGGGGSPSGVVGLISIANTGSATLVGFTSSGSTAIRLCSDNNITNTTAPTTTMGTLRMFGTYRV